VSGSGHPIAGLLNPSLTRGQQNTDWVMRRRTAVAACYCTRRCLGGYLDGALNTAAASSAEQHIAVCVRRRQAVRELQALQGLLRRSLKPAEPDWMGFWPGIMRGIQERRQVPPLPVPPHWWQSRWRLGGVLAAVMLLSLLAWLWLLEPPSSG
jgi:anti-sigma factor RsiW